MIRYSSIRWLVAIYDEVMDPDRSDLDVYVAIAEELGARGVLDVGCRTGTFALLLVERGLEVIGVDPAAGSLNVARATTTGTRLDLVHSGLPDTHTVGHATGWGHYLSRLRHAASGGEPAPDPWATSGSAISPKDLGVDTLVT